MNQAIQKELSPNTKPQELLKISAKKRKINLPRICQGDLFHNIEIQENISIEKAIITVEKIVFPFVICLNQECDLERDFERKDDQLCDSNLLHLAIAPVFLFDQFLTGSHWDSNIFSPNRPQKRTDTSIKKIIDNEIPRYHYLLFPDSNMPELIIDFKHFFTINRNVLYKNISNRMCSIDDLFREKISQRFSYYISRIGLPEK